MLRLITILLHVYLAAHCNSARTAYALNIDYHLTSEADRTAPRYGHNNIQTVIHTEYPESTSHTTIWSWRCTYLLECVSGE